MLFILKKLILFLLERFNCKLKLLLKMADDNMNVDVHVDEQNEQRELALMPIKCFDCDTDIAITEYICDKLNIININGNEYYYEINKLRHGCFIAITNKAVEEGRTDYFRHVEWRIWGKNSGWINKFEQSAEFRRNNPPEDQ
jgi:hypothetical protein